MQRDRERESVCVCVCMCVCVCVCKHTIVKTEDNRLAIYILYIV